MTSYRNIIEIVIGGHGVEIGIKSIKKDKYNNWASNIFSKHCLLCTE